MYNQYMKGAQKQYKILLDEVEYKYGWSQASFTF